jgi:two-component system chemotaxis response regulator CheY
MPSSPATRFLIVDDFSTMRRILRNLLAELGFRHVDEADDGRSALELLHGAKYDFLICDVHMPHVNGFELLQRVRADSALCSLPVLLLTAEARKEEVVQAARLGANGVICKPLTKSALEEKVLNILLKPNTWPVASGLRGAAVARSAV